MTCTTGTTSVLSSTSAGSVTSDRTLAGTLVTSGKPEDPLSLFADPTTSYSQLVQNLASLPAVVASYQNQSSAVAAGVTEQVFAHEEPTMVNFEQLEPTSGRKKWKMKHHKSLTRKVKPKKNGYQGS